MPHATDPEYKHIQVTKLGPTVGAEVSGVDFSKPVAADVFDEIFRAITQVSPVFHTMLGDITRHKIRRDCAKQTCCSAYRPQGSEHLS